MSAMVGRAAVWALVLGVLTIPLAVSAQPSSTIYRVGYLSGVADVSDPHIEAATKSLGIAVQVVSVRTRRAW
jgi:hypothetical protein